VEFLAGNGVYNELVTQQGEEHILHVWVGTNWGKFGRALSCQGPRLQSFMLPKLRKIQRTCITLDTGLPTATSKCIQKATLLSSRIFNVRCTSNCGLCAITNHSPKWWKVRTAATINQKIQAASRGVSWAILWFDSYG
jgi:hypothetical protein